MQRNRILTYLTGLFFVLLVSSAVYAGDTSKLVIHGFSGDGKYIAFEYYGNQDGSGFPYFDFFVIDVPLNKYAARPLRKITGDENNPDENLDVNKFRKEYSPAVSGLLRKFNIEGKVQGTEIRLQESVSADKLHITYSFSYGKNNYTLKLDQTETEKDCFYAKGRYFNLRLLSRDKEIILQKDKRIPKSRGCPIGYTVKKVLIYKGYIAVFLDVMLPGFEGPDIRQMVVTGSL